ncbi:ATP-dependent DNA helicase PcrA [compost metagenome]
MGFTVSDWIDTLSDDMIDLLAEEKSEVLEMLYPLNENQLRAATTIEGPTQINAVAGSGKTAVLTKRIAYMRAKGVKAGSILCTTFTKKATGEMKERLGQLVPSSYINLMTLGTTHSIAFHILKREYEALNHPMAQAFKNDMLMNAKQKMFMENLKKDILKDMNVPYEVKQELNDIAAPQFMKAFGLAKNDNIGPQEYEALHGDSANDRMQAYVLFYNRYEAKKYKERVLDGDDLLFLLVRLFQEHKDVLAKYQRKFKYLLVDEAQDNNNLQYLLIKMLGYPEYNVFLVGDDDQSMYSFRGAKPEEFIGFRKNYQGTTMIPLEYNYRSTPGILNAANLLIHHNKDRIPKKLRTLKTEEDKSVLYSHYDSENEEAQAVVGEIKSLVEDQQAYEHKRVAILYRTNAQSRAFEDQLIMSGMPYVIHGGISFYERSEVKDLVAYLKLVTDPDDNDAFERVYNKPKRYLGKAFLAKSSRFSESHWESINSQAFLKTLTYEKRGVEAFKELMTSLRGSAAAGATPEELLDIILQSGYEAFITEDEEAEEDNSRMENVATLKYVTQRFEDLNVFLDYITTMTTTAKQDIDGVQLMTVHRSKGLEFGVGFVVGLSEGLLPHYRSIQDEEEGTRPKAVEEERRLAYVGVTRAESICYVSSIAAFNGRPSKASRFIKEMMPALVMVNTEGHGVEEEYGEFIERVVENDDHHLLGSLGLEEQRRVNSLYNQKMMESFRRERRELRELLDHKDE